MYLFYDTETTGMPKNWKAPLSDSKNWPRMVQIAWMLFDEKGNEIQEADYIIQPEGYTIPYNVVRVHGISTEIARAKGVDLKFVLEEFSKSVRQAQVIIAHNISFDEKIVGAEFFRKKMDDVFFMKQSFCTMKNTTHICKIPSQRGYKWPSLNELHKYLFGKSFENQHNALADIQATAKCFWAMKERGLL